jgi:hypothetical protein
MHLAPHFPPISRHLLMVRVLGTFFADEKEEKKNKNGIHELSMLHFLQIRKKDTLPQEPSNCAALLQLLEAKKYLTARAKLQMKVHNNTYGSIISKCAITYIGICICSNERC